MDDIFGVDNPDPVHAASREWAAHNFPVPNPPWPDEPDLNVH